MEKILLALSVLVLVGFGCSQTTVLERDTAALEELASMTIPESELDVDENFELATHTVYFASSEDGEHWELREESIAKYASVPALVSLPNDLGPFPAGTLLTYFVDGTQGHGDEDVELGLVYSLDEGVTWSDRLYASVSGAPSGSTVVDPSIVELEDGRLRLYYYDFPNRLISPGELGEYEIHSAVSDDGLTFEYEQLVFVSETLITDPDVIEFDGAWYMYMMSHERVSMQVAISDDPLRFDETVKVNDNGIPGVIVVDEMVWLFSCGPDAVRRLESSDGVSFDAVDEQIVSVSPGVHCDPSVVERPSGGYAMVFKHIPEDVFQRR